MSSQQPDSSLDPNCEVLSKEHLEVAQKLQHDINCLTHAQKPTKLQALKKLDKYFSPTDNPSLDKDCISFLIKQTELRSNLLKLFSDAADTCRELAIRITQNLIVNSKETDLPDWFRATIPVLAARFSSNPETQEEVRLALIELLTKIIQTSGTSNVDIRLFMDDIVAVLKASLSDNFDELKKASCVCINAFAQIFPSAFHMCALPLAKVVTKNLSHYKGPIRQSSIETLGVVISVGGVSVLEKMMDDAILQQLRNLSTDKSSRVKEILISNVKTWIIQLIASSDVSLSSPPHPEILSRLLPLVLCSVGDIIPAVQEVSLQAMDAIGSSFLEKLSQSDKEGLQSEPQPSFTWPAPFQGRPSLGSRLVVRAYSPSIMQSIYTNIHEWTAGTRQFSVTLLHTVLLYLEGHAKDEVVHILDHLYSLSQDDDPTVKHMALQCSHLIGVFVDPPSYLNTILSSIRGESLQSSTFSQRAKVVAVFSHVVSGANHFPQFLSTYLPAIVQSIGHPDGVQDIIADKDILNMNVQLLNLIASLLNSANKQVIISQQTQILHTLLRLSVSHSTDNTFPLQTKVAPLIEELSKVSSKSIQVLHDEYLVANINTLSESNRQEITDPNTPSLLLLEATLIGCSPQCIASKLDLLIPTFDLLCSKKTEIQVRKKAMSIITKLLHHKDIASSINQWLPYMDQIVGGLLLQNMAWSAGRVAATIRGSAANSLLALMQMAERSEDSTLGSTILKTLMQISFVETFLSCLDDDFEVETRRTMCHILASLLQLGKSQLTDAQTKPIYEALLKRLDDREDSVRIEATTPLKEYLKLMQTTPEEHKEDYHSILKTLVVHFDDLNSSVKRAVGSALLQASHIQPLWDQYSKDFALLKSVDLNTFQ